MNNSLSSFFQQRPNDFGDIYLKPERKNDLKTLSTILQNIFKEKIVFEIGCGSGYWTEKIAQTADLIIATDVNESVLDIAREGDYGDTPVVFKALDFYNYNEPAQFESVFAGFIWSHVAVQDLRQFIEKVNNCVSPGGTVVFIDSNYVHGKSTPITEIDLYGNTYQYKPSQDGSARMVRKNFPNATFLAQQLAGLACNIEVIQLNDYWLLKYSVCPQ